MSKLRVTAAAHQDLLEVVEYYCARDPDLAGDFVARVERAYGLIEESPGRFASLETNRTDRDIRRVQLERFPYLVIYEVLSDQTVVLAVLHASRRPDAWRR